MNILTTKKYRAIDPGKVRKGLIINLIRKNDTIEYTGQVNDIKDTTITFPGYADGRTATVAITLTANQLYQNDYERLRYSYNLDGVYSEADNDFTIEKEATIFDPESIRVKQYVHWTQDGVKYHDGQVTNVTETRVSIDALGGKPTLQVADAEKEAFDIRVSDTLGVAVRWTVIE